MDNRKPQLLVSNSKNKKGSNECPLDHHVYAAPHPGNGNTATVYGSKGGESPTAKLMNGATWDNGAHGSAIKLDGLNDYVDGPWIKGKPVMNDMTACIWAKFDSTNSGGGRQYLIDTQYHRYSLIVDEVKSGSAVKVRIPLARMSRVT